MDSLVLILCLGIYFNRFSKSTSAIAKQFLQMLISY